MLFGWILEELGLKKPVPTFVRVVFYGGKPVKYARSGGAQISIPMEAELPEFVKEEIGY